MAKVNAKHIQTPSSLIYSFLVIAIVVVLLILVKDFVPKNQRQYTNQSASRSYPCAITATPPYSGKISQNLADKLKTTPNEKQIEVYINVKSPQKSLYPTNLELPHDLSVKCLGTGSCPSQPVFPMGSTQPTLTEEQYTDIMEKREALDMAHDAMVKKTVQQVADRVEAMGYKVSTRNVSSFSISLPPKVIQEIVKWDEISSISGISYTHPN